MRAHALCPWTRHAMQEQACFSVEAQHAAATPCGAAAVCRELKGADAARAACYMSAMSAHVSSSGSLVLLHSSQSISQARQSAGHNTAQQQPRCQISSCRSAATLPGDAAGSAWGRLQQVLQWWRVCIEQWPWYDEVS
mmetsp:Transcript_28903/g.73804  ORF Transcript_28903/g.73804 Transcript_28903/m.73804 type:complete len:138 (+) Transcript_28903:638-1051(+)